MRNRVFALSLFALLASPVSGESSLTDFVLGEIRDGRTELIGTLPNHRIIVKGSGVPYVLNTEDPQLPKSERTLSHDQLQELVPPERPIVTLGLFGKLIVAGADGQSYLALHFTRWEFFRMYESYRLEVEHSGWMRSPPGDYDGGRIGLLHSGALWRRNSVLIVPAVIDYPSS